ncbi:hypothetical protein MRB53_041516 [Persea americana]|nr:hypothetical protein MRB53_041516 [Persea americana]
MKSTWRTDKTGWTFDHHLVSILYSGPDKKAPVYQKTDPLPVLAQWSVDLWVILWAAFPMVLQWLYIAVTGENIPAVAAFVLYWLTFQGNAIHEVRILARLGSQ